MLSKLGDKVEKGRVPFLGRLRSRGGVGIWSRILDRVLRRPLLSAIVAAGVLVALTVPVLGMQTSLGGTDDTSRDLKVMRTYDRVQAAFPSEGSAEMVVIKADDATSSEVDVRHQGSRVRCRRPSGSVRGQAERRATARTSRSPS